jgi:hypothetical protein
MRTEIGSANADMRFETNRSSFSAAAGARFRHVQRLRPPLKSGAVGNRQAQTEKTHDRADQPFCLAAPIGTQPSGSALSKSPAANAEPDHLASSAVRLAGGRPPRHRTIVSLPRWRKLASPPVRRLAFVLRDVMATRRVGFERYEGTWIESRMPPIPAVPPHQPTDRSVQQRHLRRLSERQFHTNSAIS